jgi:hypothetical protein
LGVFGLEDSSAIAAASSAVISMLVSLAGVIFDIYVQFCIFESGAMFCSENLSSIVLSRVGYTKNEIVQEMNCLVFLF